MTRKPAGITLLVLAAFGLVSAGSAEAASPKKRAPNRIGPYATAFVGQTSYPGDQSNNEQALEDILTINEIPFQNLRSSTDDSDIGYHLAFGYRFHRYFAAELGLVQYGEMLSTADAELDFGSGFTPAKVSLGYAAGGVMFSALGILPLGEKFEAYGRLGYLFANVEREFISRVEGEPSLSGAAKGDSQEPVFAIGFAWNISQVYSIRAEYQKVSDLGAGSTGGEDLNTLSLGLSMRF